MHERLIEENGLADREVCYVYVQVILPGITRAYVLELARGLGIPVAERPIQLEELWGAEEALFTGTTTEIRPTVRVDGRTIGSGRPGPLTRRLYEAFLEGVTRTPAAAGSS